MKSMTPEQQREQWLKRILPALAVLVIYFAIISGFVTEKSGKAEEQYVGMVQKGINPAALQSMEIQQSGIRGEIGKLEQEYKTLHSALEANSGFLSRTGSANVTIERISVILANNKLEVLDEKRNDKPDKETLPKSLRDTRQWLKEIAAVESAADAKTAVPPADKNTDDKDLNIWTIHYIGTYLDNHRALSSLADSDIKALPVSLTMQAFKSNNKSDAGKQEWVLTLWL
jgi:hypothetical protein